MQIVTSWMQTEIEQERREGIWKEESRVECAKGVVGGA